jgi:hypothetical protein
VDTYARIEVWRVGGGWAAASARAGSRFLNLMVDCEEGAQGAVDRRRIGEAIEQVGIKEDYVRSLLQETVVVFAADGLAEIERPRLKWVGLDFGFTSAF